MKDQEVFNTVVEHLAKQGRRAAMGTSCMYRTPDGLKCAAGCLIPDNQYKLGFEGRNVSNEEIRALHCFKDTNMDLVMSLQAAHDKVQNEIGLKQDLFLIARSYNLDPSKIELITHWS